MALSEDQLEEIRILISTNYKTDDNPKGLSNRAIAKEVGCSESAVRTYIKKYNPPKNAINALAKKELDTTITVNKIKTQKNALPLAERNAYDKYYIDLSSSTNTFNNAAMSNQDLVDDAQQQIRDYILDQTQEASKNGKKSYAAIEQLPNLLAVSKATEQNRKQILGITQAIEEAQTNDKVIFNMDFGSGEDDE